MTTETQTTSPTPPSPYGAEQSEEFTPFSETFHYTPYARGVVGNDLKPFRPFRTACFDIDGTLTKARPGIQRVPYDNPRDLVNSTEEIPEAIDAALEVQAAGLRMAFLTGRTWPTAKATKLQLESFGLRVDVLWVQERFTGMEALRRFKAHALRSLRPEFYVGDTWADEMASHDAAVPFVDAADLRPPFNREAGNHEANVYRATEGTVILAGPGSLAASREEIA